MGKDSVLGHDPLSWMKMTKDIKKSAPSEEANTSGQNAGKGEQQAGGQATPKQQVLLPVTDAGKVQSPVAPPPSPVNNTANNPATPKPRVVIGKLYEKPSAEKIKPAQHSVSEVQETRRIVETPITAVRTIPSVKRTDAETNYIPASPAAATSFSLYIVVAYTALLLVLGYFVYNDLSKRTSRIEARILAIEKALHSK